jgi:molecular chaperone HtpG
MFPIIKKWLYSDHDIFLRELVSNGCDAITKLKKLALMGQTEIPEGEELKLTVRVTPSAKVLSVEDNGLGMTAEEVKEYINRIAFSGAADFLEKYKDKANEDQIIGHFGLGFYSSFMVADKVTIDTLSWEEGAEPVHWESEGGTTFTMEDGEKSTRGTTVTLYLSEDSVEFSNEYRVKEVLDKYCAFMPYPIYFENTEAEKKEAAEGEDADSAGKEAPKPVNDVNPLWLKNPSECKEEDYKEFYKKLFRDWKDPLFTIHLNMDYPFRLKGLLYFPKINLETEPAEGTIKLYSNQVFIADNIKEVIPEFLMLLKGVIDCADLPLNVSRSALQNDGFVKKISDYITKKVADKLTGMFNVDRENYEKYWKDIHPFIKYGCIRDDKFSEKIRKAIIYKNLEGKYVSLDEYLEEKKPEKTEADGKEAKTEEPAAESDAPEKDTRKTIYYVTDPVQQATYVEMFKAAGQDALLFSHAIDEPFISRLEMRYPDYKFCRIDSDVNEALTEELSEEEAKKREEGLGEIFKKALGRDKLNLKLARFKDAQVAAIMTYAEESRRMNDMFKLYGMDPSQFPSEETLVLNSENGLVKYLEEKPEDETGSLIAQQLYDLALMAHKPLSAAQMTAFSARSLKIMEKMIEK